MWPNWQSWLDRCCKTGQAWLHWQSWLDRCCKAGQVRPNWQSWLDRCCKTGQAWLHWQSLLDRCCKAGQVQLNWQSCLDRCWPNLAKPGRARPSWAELVPCLSQGASKEKSWYIPYRWCKLASETQHKYAHSK